MTPPTDPNRDARRAAVRRTVWILGSIAVALFAWTLYSLSHPA
jgi:hypothetical protein